MGNISFFIPTIHQEKYNEGDIVTLLQTNFPTCEVLIEGNIIIRNKDGAVNDFWFDTCWPLQTLELYLEEGEHFAAEKYRKNLNALLKLNLNKDMQVLSCSYRYDFSNEKLYNQVTRFIHQYFKCFWLDEGIHPEMMGPDYEFKTPLYNSDAELLSGLIGKEKGAGSWIARSNGYFLALSEGLTYGLPHVEVEIDKNNIITRAFIKN